GAGGTGAIEARAVQLGRADGVPVGGEFPAGARRRRQGRRHAGVRARERAGRAGEGFLRRPSAAGKLPEADGRHTGRKSYTACGTTRGIEMRTAEVQRNTKETQIRVRLNLDGTGTAKLVTGIPFLEHMLDQVARHGMVDLDIEAKGDLHIDAHHTVEDIGITLGQAFAKAVGDKSGIRRYGHAYVPLDEALSRVVIDLSGRPGLSYNVKFTRALIGEFDADLVH